MKTRLFQLAVACFAFLAINVTATMLYVDVNGTNSVSPFTNWISAATNIQDAVDASTNGDQILVTNGVYQTGGRAVYGTMTNRVAVDKSLTVRSVNGPQFTVIQGYKVPGTTNGAGAIRCVYLTNGATLVGFTLTNGATRGHEGGDSARERSAGGVWCESRTAVVSNCVLTGNSVYKYGGGAYQGSLTHCTLIGNSAGDSGGGAYNSTLTHCMLTNNSAYFGGGGAYSNVLNNCVLTSNCVPSSSGYGGGAAYSSLSNCVLIGNSAWAGGGAYVYFGTLNNCTLSSNSASYGGGAAMAYLSFGTLNNCTLSGNSAGDGGGAYKGTLNNCVLTANSAGRGGGTYNSTLNNCTLVNNSGNAAHYSRLNNCIVYFNAENYYESTMNYCCTMPDPGGTDNITNDPAFVDLANSNFHLQSNSPCINSGNNSFTASTNDLDGNPRIQGGTVDIGAYEYQTPTSVISYAWLQQYGLTNNGSADFADADGDGFNNWNEWRAGTSPADPSSLLKMTTVTNDVSGMVVTWQSVTNRTYFLERSTNLLAQPAFETVATDIAGQPDTTSYTDTGAVGAGPFFYRVGVQ